MPITKSKCKKPRRWVIQRTLRSSRAKGHCQTFTKKHQMEAIRAITMPWVARICHHEHIRMNALVPEEIRGCLIRFINVMLEEPYSMADLQYKIPRGLKLAIKTEYALSQYEFNRIVAELKPNAVLDDRVLSFLHKTAECFLYQLIHKGAMLAKQQGSSVLEIRHVNAIRLQYFPVVPQADDPILDLLLP